jgi:hypothetical protein
MRADLAVGDIVWGYTTVPEDANPYHPPVRVELLHSWEWDGRTLWRCKEVDNTYGSQWDWDESWLSREPVQRVKQQETGEE